MGRIQSSIGLITGIPIQDTVDQLMAVSAQPRDLLASKLTTLQNEQLALGELSARLLSFQFSTSGLGNDSTFSQKSVSSSNSGLLSATITGSPPTGTFQYTPVRQTQTHQLLSNGVTSLDAALGAGELSFRFGGFVDESQSLDILNGGEGIERGKIRITDRSGDTGTIDLRFVKTVDDVVAAINASDDIQVTASVSGDSFVLTDNTGLTASNLVVQEVSGGGTAASLGFVGVDVAADAATGTDVLNLFDDLSLSALRGGNGLSLRGALPDLEVSLRDGTTLEVDFNNIGAGSTPAKNEKTLGELIETINAVDPAKLKAEIGPSGSRLVLTDLSTDNGGTFAVTSPFDGSVAEELGLTGTAVGDTITGGKLLAGLQGSLLSTLGGGHSLGTLGELDLTDRSGATATVDLGGLETLNQVIDAINAAGVGIAASVNSARNGIVLEDTTGGAGNLVVANGTDGSETADKLRIAFDGAATQVNSGSLDRQSVSRNTLLSSLNGGTGVALGSFSVITSDGATQTVDLNLNEAETIADVITALNTQIVGVEARINDAGDGIAILDTAGGSGPLSVQELGQGTTAKDLHLLGTAVTEDIEGTPTQVIHGSTATTITVEAEDTLEDVITKINEAGANVTASVFTDGSGTKPYRLSLYSQVSGTAGELLLDTSQFSLGFNEIVAARDALLVFGSIDSPGAGILASSSSNTFDGVLPGVNLTVKGSSTSPIAVTVSNSDSSLISNINGLVTKYNELHDFLGALTEFNAEDNSTGVLFGTGEVLRVQSDLGRLFSGTINGAGTIRSLAEVGLRLNDTGKLEFDQAKFQAKFQESPGEVEKFFTEETFGVLDRLDTSIERLAGEENSTLGLRLDTLQRRIDSRQDRIDFMDERLESERERLLLQFYNMELAIGKLQSGLSAVQGISALDPYGGTA